MSTLADITILITSFLRPGYLLECVQGIRMQLPDCQIMIVDDSDGKVSPTPYLDVPNCTFVMMPFDSGLTVKRNRGVELCDTKYLLMGSDDFDFSTHEAKAGVLKLINFLDERHNFSVAGGRHQDIPYEGFLDYRPGEFIKETRLKVHPLLEWAPVDLTVNYFLARVSDIRGIEWDERMKIGGEHGDWFLELKQQGRKVAWVKGVNIDPQPHDNAKMLPEYPAYRMRAKELGHKIFKEKRNIRSYIGFDGDKS